MNSNLGFAAGANFSFDPLATLTTNGTSVTFGGFSMTNVLGLGSATTDGTYTLMNGSSTFDYTNVSNVGPSNAVSIGGGKTAYFQQGGGFQLVVVPEPATSAIVAGGLVGVLALCRRRRR